jgi:hypothetical protein
VEVAKIFKLHRKIKYYLEKRQKEARQAANKNNN